MGLTFDSTGDAELSMTLHNRRPEIIDNIFQGIPYLNAMRRYGGVEVDSTGGNSIVRGLRFSKNGTADSFSGFDTFIISPQDNETSAVWPWSSLWCHVAIAWDEEKRNSGAARLINLVNQKIDDAEMSIRDELNIQLMQTAPGAGSKDLNSIRELIDDDHNFAQPTRTDSIGAINQNTYSWWRNSLFDGTTPGTPVAFNVQHMHNLWNDCSDGSDFPDFLVGDQVSYELYESKGTDQIRYAPAGAMDQSFTALLYKTAPLVWDPQCLANAIYFINTSYHKLIIHSEGQFVTSDFIEADNGASKVAKILFMGQHVNTNRRRSGCYQHTGS